MEFLHREYPGEAPLTDNEMGEFRQLLRDRPELKKHYRDFRTLSYQELRSRTGQSVWLDEPLDKLFELAAAREEEEV